MKTPFGELKCKVKSTIHVDYLHLETLINKVYGAPLEILESQNDVSYTYDIAKGDEIDDYDRDKMKEHVQQGGFEYYYLPQYLQDMVNRDILPEGCYTINVSW